MDIAAALAQAETRLHQAGVDTPRLDARLLLAHVLDCPAPHLSLKSREALNDVQAQAFNDLTARRQRRQPVSQILGSRGFWTLDLRVTGDTLDPRPDSETVIEAVLDYVPKGDQPLRVLDLGTGTGCLLLAVLSEYPQAQGVGVDISPAALDVARTNAVRNQLDGRAHFVLGRWGEAVPGQCFDVILSNPPYIPAGDIAALQPEVRDWDPHLALDGGDDGLDCYRQILPQIAGMLVPGGVACLEIGAGQMTEGAALGGAAGLVLTEARADLGGIERCLVFKRV